MPLLESSVTRLLKGVCRLVPFVEDAQTERNIFHSL
jgi:hypothetical protein